NKRSTSFYKAELELLRNQMRRVPPPALDARGTPVRVLPRRDIEAIKAPSRRYRLSLARLRVSNREPRFGGCGRRVDIAIVRLPDSQPSILRQYPQFASGFQ